jgi:ubiquinone/menaquinone biosynthesis C-methylase UbiE
MRNSNPQSLRVSVPPPDFDCIARIYRWMEWFSFGPWLSRCRRTYLTRMAARESALVLGDGDGRFTAALLAANARIEIDAVDASGTMLQALARRARPHGDRVRTYMADARRWGPRGRRYDLVVTHFFLDCLSTDEIRELAAAVRPNLSRGAMWVVSEFAIPESRLGRLLWRPLVCGLYLAFGLLTGLSVRRLPDHRSALLDSGFTLTETRSLLRGLLVSELWIAS